MPVLLVLILVSSCANIPNNATPVAGFDAEKYLGTWYEVARLDHRFEKNLNNVIAQYEKGKKGQISVVNSGYDVRKNKWESANGSAKFRGDKNLGALKVTFFKPFYSGYNVIALDDDYRYALVAGGSLKYLWLLSRETTMPEEVKSSYLQEAAQLGYDTTKLIWVTHDKRSPFLKEE